VPLATGQAPSQRATSTDGAWGFAPHATTLEEVMRVAGARWTIASGVEAAKREAGLVHDAVWNAPFSTPASFGSHKGGENDQHTRFVQEIGSHFRHTIPYKKGVLIRFIPDLHENDIVFSENRFWLTYWLGAHLLEYR
jgi:hypothetical protein